MAFAQSRDYVFGDTRSEDGAPRRICISHIPSHTKVNDIFEFFGKETIEGITVVNKNPKFVFAFVQFKRPTDKTDALLRNQQKFLGHTIQIRNYTDGPSPKAKSKSQSRREVGSTSSRSGSQQAIEYKRSNISPQLTRYHSPPQDRRRSPPRYRAREAPRLSIDSRNDGQSRHRTRSPDRRRARSRSRSRSPARTLSISDSVYTRYRPSLSQQQPESTSAFTSNSLSIQEEDSKLAVSTVVPHHWTQPIPTPQPCSIMSAPFQAPIRPNNGAGTNNSTARNNEDEDLPPDVGLIMGIILQQRTACHLSLHQLKKVSQYINFHLLKLEVPSLVTAPLVVEPEEPPPRITEGDGSVNIDESDAAKIVADKLRRIFSS